MIIACKAITLADYYTRESDKTFWTPFFVRFTLFFTISFIALVYGFAANADGAYCDQLRTQYPGQYIRPLVECFTNNAGAGNLTNQQGYIPFTAKQFINTTRAYFVPMYSAAMLLAIVFLGIKMVTLDQSRRLKSDIAIFLLKTGGIFYFLQNAMDFYDVLMGALAQLNTIMIKAVVSATAGDGFCVKPAAQDLNIWSMWDCALNILIGATGPGVRVAGLISFIFIMIFNLGIGIAIFVAILFLIAGIFFTIARFVQYYIMSIMALSFIYSLGYLFVPLLMFKGSFKYFQKWLAICLVYVLTPVIMYGFMAMMVVAMDKIVMSGDYSIMHQIFGASAGPESPGVIVCPSDKNGTLNPDSLEDLPYCKKNRKSFFWVGLPLPNFKDPIPTNTGLIGNPDGGNSMKDNQVKGSEFDAPDAQHPGMINVGIQQVGINVDAMAQAAGAQGGTLQYLINIVISGFVACLLIYLAFSLLGYIPKLASGLVGQGTSAGSQVTSAEVFGQALASHTLELGKEALMAVATGGGSLAQTATKMATQQAAKMATKR